MKLKALIFTCIAILLLAVPIFQLTSSAKDDKKENEKKVELTEATAAAVAGEWAKKQMYVQRGGDYKENEYQSFELNGTYYRYLASDIGTMDKLMNYLTETVTEKFAKDYVAKVDIREHEGKTIQIEADGGSLLDWSRATAKEVDGSDKEKEFEVTVPVGETNDVSIYTVHFNYNSEGGWKISDFFIIK